MKTAEVKSSAEELDILYNLKNLVRQHRSGKKIKLTDIFSAYAQSVPIAAKRLNKTDKALFDTLMTPFKQSLVENISPLLEQQSLSIPKELLPLFDADKVSAFNKKIKEIQKLQAKLLATPQAAEKKTPKTSEEPSIVTELRAEFIAAVKSKKLPAAEEKQLIDAAENTSGITLSSKNKKFFISIDGVAEAMETNFPAKGASWFDKDNKPKFSKYNCCSKESLAIIAKIKSKTFKTQNGEDKAAEKRAQQLLEQKNEKLSKEILTKQQELPTLLKDVVIGLDGKALFEALALDSNKGKKLLGFLRPDSNNDKMQDVFREGILDSVIWDKQVWSLYQKEAENSANNDKRSHYEKLQEKASALVDVTKVVSEFMEINDNSKTRRDVAISKIAGTELPRELAQDMFLKGVYNYGMAVKDSDKFTMDKFNQMNDVLGEYGYKICLEEITAQRACPEGAQKVSKLLLEQMSTSGIKAEKNKTIALMYKIGALLAKDTKADISKPYSSEQISNVYTEFCNQGYRCEYWKNFVENAGNRTKALQIYSHFQQQKRSSKQLETWIKNMSAGHYPEGGKGLMECSDHHGKERKFGGLFKDSNQLFNSRDNITTTINFHPADNDMHKDEAHRFDMREIYLYMQEDKYKTGSITGINEGDKVYIPVTYKKDASSNFKQVIPPETLLVTSQGLAVSEPEIPGRSNQRGISGLIKSLDNQGVSNSGGRV